MSLTQYRKKRRFQQTSEPVGALQRSAGQLRFVVQKHHAPRLHYDFRLELDGVLKSWAVPKGPSLDPRDKRLAMMVEDHPLDYRTFEGIIPKGNYGAGTVMVWDEGTYHPPETGDRREGETLLRKGLEKGHLRLVLDGKKLRGEFALVKFRKGEENARLLFKKQDSYANAGDVREQDRSALSGRTLEEIAGQSPAAGAVWTSNRKTILDELKDTPRAKAPHNVVPMLATLVDQPFDRPGWLFEIKWDGYRAIAEVGKHGVRLYSRNHLSFNERYHPIVAALEQIGHEAVLDGEVVALDHQGKARFQLLQNYQKTADGQLAYYVFDLLHLDGHDLRPLPLMRRKKILQTIVGGIPQVRLSEHVEERGKAFFKAAQEQGLEGIMAKDGKSPYREGQRTHEWLKIKPRSRQEAVIGGFTEPRGSRKDLGALVLGVYEGDALAYIGHTGGGFTGARLTDIKARLKPLVQRACPFKKRPAANAPVHWVRPELVCEVMFQEWTQDGHMRQPIFLGLREDKPAHSVRREQPEPVAQALATERQESTSRRRRVSNEEAAARNGHLDRNGAAEPAIALTHLEKIYWPEEGYTKGDLIDYYRGVAPLLLTYLRDRPQSLHRHPNGIAGQSFFQKDVGQQAPPWAQTVKIYAESSGKEIHYLLCQDETTLLYLANLGCIELNPWLSRVGSLDRPDFFVLDLDPEDVSFDRVIDVAQAVRKVLDGAGAAGYCKTSGKRGLHVCVPLGARYDYDQAKQFAELVAQMVHARLPELTSLLRSPSQRRQRVYLDYLQNRRGQTLAAPYSVRPSPGAPVSTPLKWSEVRRGLDPDRFTIRTMKKRLDQVGDLWQPVVAGGVDLKECLQRLASPGTSYFLRTAQPKQQMTGGTP